MHRSVLLRETLKILNPIGEKLYLDCTFGGGGHSQAILRKSKSNIIAIDCDSLAEDRSKGFKEFYGKRFKFYNLNFSCLDQIPENKFDGILFDFGTSSFQLNDNNRGFSFSSQKIDMRFNPLWGSNALQFINNASGEQLIQAIRDYGEERNWRRIVSSIKLARGTKYLHSGKNFSELIKNTKNPFSNKRIHPATKTFQGIRIAVNDELKSIQSSLPRAFSKLSPGGILIAICFHSLEDRLVKRFMNAASGKSLHTLDGKSSQTRKKEAVLLTPKPILPGIEEILSNKRSRSAKLRAIKKI